MFTGSLGSTEGSKARWSCADDRLDSDVHPGASASVAGDGDQHAAAAWARIRTDAELPADMEVPEC